MYRTHITHAVFHFHCSDRRRLQHQEEEEEKEEGWIDEGVKWGFEKSPLQQRQQHRRFLPPDVAGGGGAANLEAAAPAAAPAEAAGAAAAAAAPPAVAAVPAVPPANAAPAAVPSAAPLPKLEEPVAGEEGEVPTPRVTSEAGLLDYPSGPNILQTAKCADIPTHTPHRGGVWLYMVSHEENENEGGCALQHDAVAEPELAGPWGKADYTIKVRREGRKGGRRRAGGNIFPSVQALIYTFFLLFSLPSSICYDFTGPAQ